jgi:hypothetical protein
MFHRFQRSAPSELAQQGRHRYANIRTFTWIIAVLVVALLAGGLVEAALAAKAASPAIDSRPLLKVVPKNVGIPGDGINCKGILSNGTSVCQVTLTEVKSASKPLHWFTRSDFPATFHPPSGNLTPGQSVQVFITTNFCGGFTNFSFVGPKNVATVTFQCG